MKARNPAANLVSEIVYYFAPIFFIAAGWLAYNGISGLMNDVKLETGQTLVMTCYDSNDKPYFSLMGAGVRTSATPGVFHLFDKHGEPLGIISGKCVVEQRKVQRKR